MTTRTTTISLQLETRQNRWVREGLPLTSTPYAQIIGISEGMVETRSETQPYSLTVPRRLGERLLDYASRRVWQSHDPKYPLRSCVDFGAFLVTGQLYSDREQPFKILDELFKSEQSKPLVAPSSLQLGEIALIGGAGGQGDCWCGECCIVHAALGLGEEDSAKPNVLEVKALGGNWALDTLSNSLDYYQNLEFPWAATSFEVRSFRPEDF